jgi:hypothetical protein
MKHNIAFFWIVALTLLTSCSKQVCSSIATKEEPIPLETLMAFSKRLDFNDSSCYDAVHHEAVSKIITRHGLSSTGHVYFSGHFSVSKSIEGFCEKGDEIFEYKTSHFFTSLMSVIWYNPKTKQTHELY